MLLKIHRLIVLQMHPAHWLLLQIPTCEAKFALTTCLLHRPKSTFLCPCLLVRGRAYFIIKLLDAEMS